jgi:SnoaL-like domain
MNKIQRREIEADCISLSHAFAYHLDHKDYKALAELFAPSGVFIRTGVRLEGPEQILATMSQRPAEQFTRHVTTNFHFTQVDENIAKAVVYNVSYYSMPESQLPLDFVADQLMLLDFIDTYTRTPDGWRFLERDARPLLIPKDLRSKLPAATATASASH